MIVTHTTGGPMTPGRTIKPRLSTPEDIDSRTGDRRLLVDTYELHADVVDDVRLALMHQRDFYVGFLGSDSLIASRGVQSAIYRCAGWVEDLWNIERACRALGIED